METKDKDSKIIQKCIDISCLEKSNLNNKIFSLGWKNTIANLKDNLKYNLIRFNSKFTMPLAKVNLFNKIYDTRNETEKTNFYKKFSKIIMVTYRSKYRPQINIKNNKEYTSDCGWGCMIRSSQMILCRALYKIFKYKLNQKDNLIIKVIPFIMENYLNINEKEYFGMNDYINKLKSYGKKDIVEIDPPFSIHKICILGEKYGRACGEWFSDFELPKIYDTINTVFNIISDLSIIHFNSTIELKVVLNRCFKEEINNNDNNQNKIINENEIEIDEKKYSMEKMGLIFVSNRIGLDSIAPVYFPSLKNLFNCKECIGFLGGKKNSNSASYFIGYYKNNLLYLDPHHNNPTVENLDENNINTYINKTLYKLNLTSINSAFTIGFLFRNIKEFSNLLEFFEKVKKEENPCFDYTKKINRENPKINEISTTDDF